MALVRSSSALTVGTFESAIRDGAGCDLTGLTFIDVFGLVGCSIALCHAHGAGTQAMFSAPDAGLTRSHLAYMGLANLLDALEVPHGLPELDPAAHPEVVVPLQRTANTKGIDEVAGLVFSQLERRVDPQVLNALVEALWELAQNVIQHSGSLAILAAQVYPKGNPPFHDGTVQVAIGDSGRGIRASFLATGLHAPSSDREAIDLAVQYLVSSVDDPGRGQGLHTTIGAVRELRGHVVIRSGTGRLAASHSSSGCATKVPFLPGTLVGVVLPLRPGTPIGTK